MNEKKWTDDERDEAFDRGMETMQRVALELYRRGREPLLEELEEARARNADMRAMLEQVTRERDEWRDKFHAVNQTAGELCNACGWAFRIPGEPCRCEVVKERDEARAEAERYLADLRRCASEPYERTRELEALQAEVERLRETNDYLRTWLSSEELEGLRVKAAEHPLLWEEIHHLKAEVERLREKYDSVLEANVSLLDGAPYVDARAAFRRGAEAMREACAVRAQRYLGLLIVEGAKTAEAIRNLPIPEDK